jgi:hypothetical protein
LCFVFSFISPFVLCFPSVSNFYFTSQYHQFPTSFLPFSTNTTITTTNNTTTTTTDTTTPAAAVAAIALKFHPKHEKRKQKTLTKRTNSH